ncbi:hypothetical protein [Calothrix sp. PCC 7507]|uniref:hypothetical protein n=1 Tax=Calothrix sp. PCC 7507 TaxID=99598 RepID=UPI00029F4173|nr:hypothetical protein [Calothrix sp. PCC 7507]AFY31830.1 hypothetical protein Cal7507_1363 [Calothrix sp. PCC 7507]
MLKQLGISFLLAVSLTSPVNALPGQKFETAMKFYTNNPLFEKITYGGTGGSYGSTHHYYTRLKQSASSSFEVYTDNRRQNIIIEAVDLGDANEIVLDRSSISNLQVIKNIFNSIVVNDFQNSKYILKRTREVTQSSEFYEGKKFNYRVFRSSGNINFAVISKKSDLKSIIQTDSVCHGAFFDCPG